MRKLALGILMNIVLGVLAASSYAGLYIWTDANGVKHYSDAPPVNANETQTASTVKELLKTEYYNLPVFIVKDGPDPGILGTYHPIYPTSRGFPQYRLKDDDAPNLRWLPKLSVMAENGRWRWKISTRYSKYISSLVSEGTPADRVIGWSYKYKDGDAATIVFDQEEIVTNRKMFEHTYYYDLDASSEPIEKWRTMAFRISGNTAPWLNGDYLPVKWSSGTPRYKKDQNTCLTAKPFAESWEWHLGECERYPFTADREPTGTMPHEVSKWYERRGIVYVPFTIKALPHPNHSATKP